MQVETFIFRVGRRSSRIITVAKFVFKCAAFKHLELGLLAACIVSAASVFTFAFSFFQTATKFFVILFGDNRVVRILGRILFLHVLSAFLANHIGAVDNVFVFVRAVLVVACRWSCRICVLIAES